MDPAAGHVARHGGPLDGQVVQPPVRGDGQPGPVIGFPVLVLDERRELFWWDTGNYFIGHEDATFVLTMTCGDVGGLVVPGER